MLSDLQERSAGEDKWKDASTSYRCVTFQSQKRHNAEIGSRVVTSTWAMTRGSQLLVLSPLPPRLSFIIKSIVIRSSLDPALTLISHQLPPVSILGQHSIASKHPVGSLTLERSLQQNVIYTNILLWPFGQRPDLGISRACRIHRIEIRTASKAKAVEPECAGRITTQGRVRSSSTGHRQRHRFDHYQAAASCTM